MVRGVCAALVGLPSDQVSEPFTICPPITSRAALRSCRPPILASASCPGPITLVASGSGPSVGHPRLLSRVIGTAAVSSDLDT